MPPTTASPAKPSRREKAVPLREVPEHVPLLDGRRDGTGPIDGATRRASSSATSRFQPSVEEVDREAAGIESLALSAELQDWVDEYSRVGQRNPYLWKWCRRGVEVTTLSCVEAGLADRLADTKVLGVMLDVLIDDVADERGDDRFLEYLLDLPFGVKSPSAANGRGWFSLSREERAYAEFAVAVWSEIDRRVRRLPRYEEFQALLAFDYRQLFNAMRYSHLINGDPSLLNLTEHDLYLPHNMHMMVSATVDLMSSPAFNHDELGALREAVNRAQYMGRIGNLITTWEREVAERDFTSGVFAAALSMGAVTPDDLLRGDRSSLAAAIRSGRFEEYFLRRWHRCRRELVLMQRRLQSVDVNQLVAGLERLIRLHLGSRGHK